jgi:Rrf2 family protein
MRLSTKARYGARAVVDIARNWGKTPTKRKDIALRQHISNAYLENILIALKSGGIVRTTRGAQGGFALTRSPQQITLLDVFQALDGELAPVECAVNKKVCERSADCVMRTVYEKLKQAQDNVLSGITLQDLVDQSSTGRRHDYAI